MLQRIMLLVFVLAFVPSGSVEIIMECGGHYRGLSKDGKLEIGNSQCCMDLFEELNDRKFNCP